MVMRATKIVCTIGPASATVETLEALVRAGMNVARLNFSHGDHESHQKLIQDIRAVAKRLKEPVAILQDLCGPKIRLGMLPEEGIRLNPDDLVVLASSELNVAGALPVDYARLHIDVSVGAAVMLADGLMELRVEKINGAQVECRVINGGIAYRRKGVNLPCSDLSISAFTAKDREDLRFGLEQGVDVVALSFVRNATDLDEIRTMIAAASYTPKLVAKIEKPQALEGFDAILERVDGVMIARGDLGVEVPLETVPVIQKDLLHRARIRGKFTITATQMLSSMVSSPRPTRAEATDVANAIYDGTDALMLSDETASGAYPVEAARMLDRIARATEPHVHIALDMDTMDVEDKIMVGHAIGRACSWLARDLHAAAIVAYTWSGLTARCVARYRPDCVVVAMSPDVTVCRQLNLIRGVKPVEVGALDSSDALFVTARRWCLRTRLASLSDCIVVTAGTPLWQPGSTNLIKVIELDKGMDVRCDD